MFQKTAASFDECSTAGVFLSTLHCPDYRSELLFPADIQTLSSGEPPELPDLGWVEMTDLKVSPVQPLTRAVQSSERYLYITMASKPSVLLCCLFTQKFPLERQSGLFFSRRNSLLASLQGGVLHSSSQCSWLCVLRPSVRCGQLVLWRVRVWTGERGSKRLVAPEALCALVINPGGPEGKRAV